MKLSRFDYELPRELIAQSFVKRGQSRMMVLKDNKIFHKRFSDIINYFKKGDVLVLNETKVVPNRLLGKKSTGGKIEVILEFEKKEMWQCRIKGSKIRKGAELVFDKELKARVVEKSKDVFFLKFNKKFNLEKVGRLPLPFYVKSKLVREERYQTVYSSKKGSLAAPTAGLHFSKQILDKIKKKGVKIAKVTLHINFGTFLPIRVDDIRKHKMHYESFEVTQKNADIINNRKGRLIVVGTTVVRTLESSFKNNKVIPNKTQTNLYIYPGYKFKNKIDIMLTNFHLPKSSLLLLVSAFYGRTPLLKAYKQAVKHKYRFYSFGDCMLLQIS